MSTKLYCDSLVWAKISISLVIRVIKDNLHVCDFCISLGSVKINAVCVSVSDIDKV